jgi:hypothetical protein
MRPKQNLIGKSFGKLVVISEAPKHKNDFAPYWKCKCECGNETDVRAQHLTDGVTKSCGGIHHRTGSKHYRWKGCGEVSGRYICDLKKHAKEKGFPFDITKEEIWEQFLKQNKSCALTGQHASKLETFPIQKTVQALLCGVTRRPARPAPSLCICARQVGGRKEA